MRKIIKMEASFKTDGSKLGMTFVLCYRPGVKFGLQWVAPCWLGQYPCCLGRVKSSSVDRYLIHWICRRVCLYDDQIPAVCYGAYMRNTIESARRIHLRSNLCKFKIIAWNHRHNKTYSATKSDWWPMQERRASILKSETSTGAWKSYTAGRGHMLLKLCRSSSGFDVQTLTRVTE